MSRLATSLHLNTFICNGSTAIINILLFWCMNQFKTPEFVICRHQTQILLFLIHVYKGNSTNYETFTKKKICHKITKVTTAYGRNLIKFS